MRWGGGSRKPEGVRAAKGEGAKRFLGGWVFGRMCFFRAEGRRRGWRRGRVWVWIWVNGIMIIFIVE